MTQNHTPQLREALAAVAMDVCEFASLADHLNEPDNPTPLALVLRRHADRLLASSDALETLLNGGMGGMPPMATQKPANPNSQFAASPSASQFADSRHD